MNCFLSTSHLSSHIGDTVKIENPDLRAQKVAGFTSIIVPIDANRGKGSALNTARQIQKKVNNQYLGKLFGDVAFVDTTLRDEVLVHIRPNGKVLDDVNKKASFMSESFEPTQEVKPGVEELFESDPKLAKQVYEALGFNRLSVTEIGVVISKEQQNFALQQYSEYLDITQDKFLALDDKIVFGHPTIGKSFLKKEKKDNFISLDDDYSTEINSEVIKIADRYNVTTYQVKDGGTQKWNNEYNQMMQEMFNVAKQRAVSEGKTLFTSNTNLLKNNAESFDKVINLTDKEFEKRIQQRGAKYDIKEWKSQINEAIAVFPTDKILNTDKYLSDLFRGSEQDIEGFKEFVSKEPYNLTVEELRAQEIQEFRDTVENADSFITDGRIDSKKVKASENTVAKEIYDKYDKLISPLLNEGEIDEFKNPNEDPISEGYQGYDSFMPATMNQSTGITYDNIVYFKEVQLSKIQERIAQMQSDSAFDKSTEHKKQIAELKKIEEDIKNQISNMLTDPNIFEMKLSVLNPDIELIERILSSPKPTLENLKIAAEAVEYFRNISDYSSANENNKLVDVSKPELIDPAIKQTLNELNDKVRAFDDKIYKAKVNYLRDYITKSESIKELYFKGQVKATLTDEEVNDIVKDILGDIADLSFVDTWFNALGSEMNIGGQESLLVQMIKKTLSDKRNVEKSRAADLTQAISDIEDKAKRKLNSLGYLGIFKGAPYTNWDLFYQQDANGNKTGKLIGKFSDRWDKALRSFISQNNAEFNEAMRNKDYKAAAAKKAEKFSWINSNADFLNISLVPEIANDPRYKVKFPGSLTTVPAQAEAYKKQVIEDIGEFEYNKIVKEQIDLLEGFIQYVETELEALMDSLEVNDVDEIPAEDLISFNIGVTVRNPFLVLDSKRKHQGGRVDFNAGNASTQYQSLVTFNTFFPKREVTRVNPNTDEVIEQETGYFDAQYDEIAKDQDLLKLWENFSEAAFYINEGLNDSEQRLSHNSLWEMKKSMLEVLFSKNVSNMGKPGGLFRETGKTLKGLFTESTNPVDPKDQEKMNKPIQSIDGVVNERLEMLIYKMSIAQDKKVTFSSKLKRKNLTPATISLIETVIQKDISELLPNPNTPFRLSDLKNYIANQVREEQSFDLPTMVKAYLDIVSEYRAKKAAINEVTMMQGLYKTIKRRNTKQTEDEEGERKQRQLLRGLLSSPFLSGNKTTDISKERVNAQTRLDYWINKQVKGLEDNTWKVKLGKKQYSKEEQEYKKTLEDYKEFLEVQLEEVADEAEEQRLQVEISEIDFILENLGQYYTLNAVAETLVNRLNVFLGLAFNPPAQIVNRVQGWFSGMINDTGRYWTAGNFNVANSFINRKSLRHFGKLGLTPAKEYADQIKITRLLVQKMAILQDATNELDRASRSSGATRIIDVLKPYGLTQYTEWHNQVPQILSILMDVDIKDENGNVTKVFSGSDFPAFDIVEGRVSLKPGFNTPENQETWVNMSSQEANRIKDRATNTIALLNGDYSKLGSTYIKKYFLGRLIMTFKTWLSSQIGLRFGENQKNLALSLDNFDGAYTGALKNKKTSVAGTAGILAMGAIGGVTTGIALPISLGLAGALSVGLVTRAYINRRNADTAEIETINAGRQLAAMGKALTLKVAGLPINAISGKNLVPNYTFENLTEKETDRQNLMFIINEVTGTLYFVFTKVILAAAWASIGGGDEEELKEDTIAGTNIKIPNDYYGNSRKDNISKQKEELYIALENQITQIIQTTILYTDPVDMVTTMMDPKGLTKFFEQTDNVFKTYIKAQYLGEEEIMQGPNQGQDKLYTSTSKFLPVLANEILIKKEFKFGFANKVAQEWEKDELVDIYFKNSDYKRDLKSFKSDRAGKIKELQEQIWDREDIKQKYDAIESAAGQKAFEEQVTKEIQDAVDASFIRPSRSLYDENQKRLDLEKLKSE